MGGWNIGRATPVLVLLVAALLAPIASAGASVDLPVGRVEVVDQHGTDCGLGLGACPATVTGDGAGDARVDASQRIERIRVVLDFSIPRQAAGRLWLLPDASLVVDGADLFLPIPVYRLTGETLARVPFADEAPVRVEITEDNMSIWRGEALGGYKRFPYAPKDRMGLQYEGISLYNAKLYGNTTDGYAEQMRRDPCMYARVCSPHVDAAFATYNATTPDAFFGFEVAEAQVATRESLLDRARGAPLRSASADAPATHASALPAPRLTPLDDDAPPRLQREPWVAPSRDGAPAAERAPLAPRGRVVTAALVHEQDLPKLWTLVATGALLGLLVLAATIALYSRFSSREEAMRSRTRHRVLAALQAEPGISPTDLAKRVGVTRNAVTHHVKILVAQGLVSVERRRRRHFVFPRGAQHIVHEMVVARLCEDDPLLQLLARHPGLTRADVHRLLPHVPQRTRNHKLRRLLELGALRREGHDGAERYYVAVE